MLAIMNAHFDTAAVLIDKGADPNVTDSTGMTALYVAVDMHTLGPMMSRPSPKLVDKIDAADVVKLLLAHGANLERPAEAADHRTAPHADRRRLARRRRDAAGARGQEQRSPGDAPAVRRRRRSAADDQGPDDGAMIAAAGGAVVGAYAVAIPVTEESSLEALKLCVEHGVDVNAFNTNGMTALHNAVHARRRKVVQYLAEQGAKLDLKNKQGRLPLDIALGVGGGAGRGAVHAAAAARPARRWRRCCGS